MRMSENDDIRLTRTHVILHHREEQISRNIAAVEGGKPYIDLRLNRFPSESDSSWCGDSDRGVVGRKERAYNINYPRRITSKLNQYVFGNPITREGADEEFVTDVTRCGQTANEFMEHVNEAYTSGGWCWVSVDRGSPPLDEEGNPVQRSQAQREASRDRVYWILWSPTEVVDWHYSKEDGRLLWLITETSTYDNSDPDSAPVNMRQRSLWQRDGQGIRFETRDGGENWTETPFTYAGGDIPFHMVGKASAKPHWFDDVEILQAAILNLLSADQENIVEAVFPQLVLPFGLIENVMAAAEVKYEQAIEMVRGLNYPLFEPSEDSGTSRFISPDAGDMETIPKRLADLKKELYDVVGLAMSMGGASAQVQSAESKRWDHLDPESTLKELSSKLEAAEQKLVQFSRQLDSTFSVYDPVYPRKFDIEDTEELTKSLTGISMLPLPPEADKEVKKAALKILSRITPIGPERMQELVDEIDSYDPSLRAIVGDD